MRVQKMILDAYLLHRKLRSHRQSWAQRGHRYDAINETWVYAIGGRKSKIRTGGLKWGETCEWGVGE